jgi:hypothetical protein
MPSSNNNKTNNQWNWSGKVKIEVPKKPAETQYFYEGKKVASVGGGGGTYSGGGGTYNIDTPGEKAVITPTSYSVQALQSQRTLAKQNAIAEQEAKQRDQNFIISNKVRTSTGYGTFAVSQSEQDAMLKSGRGYNIPSYVPSATTPMEAITEGSITGSTQLSYSNTLLNPIVTKQQYEYNVGQLTRAKDIFNYAKSFQSNPEQFVSTGEALGITTSEGTSYTLTDQAISNKFYSPEANLLYNKVGREYFNTLPYSTRLVAANQGWVIAATKLGLGTVEFGGTIAKTILGSGEVGNGMFGKIRNFEIGGSFSGQLKSLPSSQSIYPTLRVPLVGLEIPKTFKGVPEFFTRPEQTLIAGSLAVGGYGLVKGGLNALSLYKAERLTGASRLGALDVVGGEAMASIVRINDNTRIFAAEPTSLKPFKTSQLNKGAEITSIKTGEINGNPIFEMKGTSTSFTPSKIDYLSYKPRLTGGTLKKMSVEANQFQIISLKGNAFSIKETEMPDVFKISGRGQRDVWTFKQDVFQDSRYTLGNRVLAQKSLQQFNSFGKAKLTDIGFNTKSFKFDNEFFTSQSKEPKVRLNVKPLDKFNLGYYSPNTKKIYITKNTLKGMKGETYLHERFHYLVDKQKVQIDFGLSKQEKVLVGKEIKSLAKEFKLKENDYLKSEYPEEVFARIYETGIGLEKATPKFRNEFYSALGKKYPILSKATKNLLQNKEFRINELQYNIVKSQLKGFDSVKVSGEIPVAIKTTKQLSVSFDKTSFKNLERFTYKGGYKAFGKDFMPTTIKEGKAFGSGISGRPSTAKGLGFNLELGRIESDKGLSIFGKSISKFSGGGRRGVQLFNTKTLVPTKNMFEVTADKSFIPKETTPKGITVTRIKSEPFELLSRGNQVQIKEQKVLESSTKSVFAPTRTSFGELKQTTQGKQVSGFYPRTNTRLSSSTKLGLASIGGLSLGSRNINALALGLGARTTQALRSNEITISAQDTLTGQTTRTSQFTSQFTPSSFKGFTNMGFIGAPPIVPFAGLPSLGGWAIGNPRQRGRKSNEWRLSPSFTAIIENIKMKNPLKVSKTWGVTPFQTRGLLVGKKSKGAYYQITDL